MTHCIHDNPCLALTALFLLRTGDCDDCGVRDGVPGADLVRRLLLPVPRMAGTAAIRSKAILHYR